MKKFDTRHGFALVTGLILIVNIVIALDVPFLRQYLGALFYTLVPGWLILSTLKLNKLGTIEKLVLSVGLSLAFLMFVGLMINTLYYAVGYSTPLSTISLLSSFSIILLIIAIIAYRMNREAFALAVPFFDTREKIFLVLPALLPLLSISGMHLMNTNDNNTLLISMLFLIAGYVAYLAISGRRVPARIYPAILFLIGVSLTLMLGLRSSYIIGADVHYEYYLFRVTADNLHWGIITDRPLDSCLSISLLPAVYHSLLGGSEQYLFKLLYPTAFAFCPLVVYAISRKYVAERYAFLASVLFISQVTFIRAAYNARTVTAVLFFSLAIMVLLIDRIEPARRNGLFLFFVAATIVSHYSTSYIFLFIILATWLLTSLLGRRYAFPKRLTLITVMSFSVLVFLWYAQLAGFETGWTFVTGARAIRSTLISMRDFFLSGSRGEELQTVMGALGGKGIASVVHVVFTWVVFILTGLGVLNLLRRYKESGEYLALVLVCSGVMVAMVALPYVSRVYSAERTLTEVLVILSPLFVTGGVWLAERLRASPPLLLCLVLIPYFLSVTGVTYQIADSPYKDITFNSSGDQYNQMYIHEQEAYSAQWLEYYRKKGKIEDRYEASMILADPTGVAILMSQGKVLRWWLSASTLTETLGKVIRGGSAYIYLRYDNVINNRIYYQGQYYEFSENDPALAEMRRIYSNGGSEVWR